MRLSAKPPLIASRTLAGSAPTVPAETGASRWRKPMDSSLLAYSRACDSMTEDM